ncbi:hypothetical protein AB3331_10205 [Streptococcus sp. H49]|uniref:SLAC1 family transporter n=1 Tax=Streptococcus huangxiaojuni TaxID=3237239 RepID=UPI0034A23042
MVHFIKKIPLALAGLILGIIALGNLFAGICPPVRFWIFGFTLPLLVLLFLRLVVTRENLRKEFSSPVTASGFAALLMALSFLVNASPFNIAIRWILWLLVLMLYLLYIAAFSFKFVLSRNLALVYPSWVIVYVGIAAASTVPPLFPAITAGWWIWTGAVIGYLLLMPVIFYRLLRFGIEKAYYPTLIILAAPTSLLLTSYLNLSPHPNRFFVIGLTLLAQFLYALVLVRLPKILAQNFTPLYASVTFPLVNSALALRLSLAELAVNHLFFSILADGQAIIAVLSVVYVSYGYFRFFLKITEAKDRNSCSL